MSGWELDTTVNRIFDDFIKDLNVARRGSGTRSSHVKAWTPAIDVHETDKEFVVFTELPVCIFNYIFLHTHFFNIHINKQQFF
jgi:HSP20 family molecular chaperone IbpA